MTYNVLTYLNQNNLDSPDITWP